MNEWPFSCTFIAQRPRVAGSALAGEFSQTIKASRFIVTRPGRTVITHCTNVLYQQRRYLRQRSVYVQTHRPPNTSVPMGHEQLNDPGKLLHIWPGMALQSSASNTHSLTSDTKTEWSHRVLDTWHIVSPSQEWSSSSRRYPAPHRHEKDPSELAHSSSQLWEPSWHSFISDIANTVTLVRRFIPGYVSTLPEQLLLLSSSWNPMKQLHDSISPWREHSCSHVVSSHSVSAVRQTDRLQCTNTMQLPRNMKATRTQTVTIVSGKTETVAAVTREWSKSIIAHLMTRPTALAFVNVWTEQFQFSFNKTDSRSP